MGNVNRFDVADQRAQALTAASEAIARGECIVLPTDTVYGIAASALQPAAIARLLAAKQRGRDMPPPVLIAEPAMLAALTDDIPYFVTRLAEHCWPGALTLILRAQDSLNFDLGETSGTIAVRVPDHEFTRELLRHTGPLAVSSANISGREAATSIEEAIEMLGESVTVYLDDGTSPGGVASTIIDFVSTSTGRIVRKGALSFETLSQWNSQLKDLPETAVSSTPSGEQIPDGAETEITTSQEESESDAAPTAEDCDELPETGDVAEPAVQSVVNDEVVKEAEGQSFSSDPTGTEA